MLNKDLLQFSRNGGRISCRFIAITQAELDLADMLLGIYRQACAEQWRRSDLEENLEPLIKGAAQNKLLGGMNKLILDHCEFTAFLEEMDVVSYREQLFRQAAEVLKNPPADAACYRQMVWQKLGQHDLLREDIYGDLPEFDVLKKVPEWNAWELCNMYNTALVQGLLLYAGELELHLFDTDAMALRKFMRRLKFYRLLAEVHKISAHEVKLTLSGPASVLGEKRKYGLQLASFFPVILLLKNWKLRAKLYLRSDEQAETLNLSDRKCDLKSPLRRWSVCLPEEVALFVKAFREQAQLWQEAPEAPWPQIAGAGPVFPDFSFVHASAEEAVVHVELFHRYYQSNLEERLSFLQQHRDFPLIIGIDRAILGKTGEKELMQRYQNLHEYAFFFSNYPGVERVRKMLDGFWQRLHSLPLEQ